MSHHAEDARNENLNAMQIVKLISDGRKKKKQINKNCRNTVGSISSTHTYSSQGMASKGRSKGKRKAVCNGKARKKKSGTC